MTKGLEFSIYIYVHLRDTFHGFLNIIPVS